MGDIAPSITHTIQISLLNSKDVVIGQMRITLRYDQHEDGALDPRKPSGPANRKIVQNQTGSDIVVWFNDDKFPHKDRIQKLADSLQKQGGLIPEKGTDLVPFEDSHFIELLNALMTKEFELKATRY